MNPAELDEFAGWFLLIGYPSHAESPIVSGSARRKRERSVKRLSDAFWLQFLNCQRSAGKEERS